MTPGREERLTTVWAINELPGVRLRQLHQLLAMRAFKTGSVHIFPSEPPIVSARKLSTWKRNVQPLMVCFSGSGVRLLAIRRYIYLWLWLARTPHQRQLAALFIHGHSWILPPPSGLRPPSPALRGKENILCERLPRAVGPRRSGSVRHPWAGISRAFSPEHGAAKGRGKMTHGESVFIIRDNLCNPCLCFTCWGLVWWPSAKTVPPMVAVRKDPCRNCPQALPALDP